MYNIELTLIQRDLEKLCKKHPKLKQEFRKVCEKLEQNPKSGKLMRRLPKDLSGKIWRYRLLGRKGFRFIYYWEKGSQTISALLIFQKSRDEDYAKAIERVTALSKKF